MAVEVGATRLLAQVVSEKAIGLWGPGNEDKVFQSLSESFSHLAVTTPVHLVAVLADLCH